MAGGLYMICVTICKKLQKKLMDLHNYLVVVIGRV